MDRSILILILLFNSGKPFVTEPTCSKFHYEEQTLEKMIRQEVKIEKMKTDIELTEKRVIDALEELKAERIEFNKDMSKKEDDIKKLREIMNKELKRMNIEFNGTIDNYSKGIQKISASKISPVVAFKADTVKDVPINNGMTFVFPNIILNIGDAYNNNDGVFTAPATGLYLFTVQFCLNKNVWAYIGIVVNGKAVTRAGIGESKWRKCYTIDAITLVEKGNDVCIKCSHSCDTSDTVFNDDFATSSFSGALIHKTV